MGKKKGNNNKQEKQEEVVEAVADVVIDALKGDKQADNSATTTADSYGESPADTPTAPPTESARTTKANIAEDTTKTAPAPIEKEKYTIVPDPIEETAVQRVSGYYRRLENNERTEKEAAEEEAYNARLSTLKGEERAAAERTWAYKPVNILLDVAFANNEKFARLYLEAQQEAFLFMVATDLQRGKAAIQETESNLRAKTDSITREEYDIRSNIRKEAREALNALIVDKDSERRAALTADREAKRKARNDALPAPPQGLDSQQNYDSASQLGGSD